MEDKKTRNNRIRIIIAWLGTIGLLAFLYFTTDIDAALTAIRQANLTMFLVTAFSSVGLAWMTDVASVRFLLDRVGIRVGFGEFAKIKGASYLLNIVNYNLALVMMAAIVKKRSSKGWGAAGSPFILLNFIDLTVFSLIVQIAVWSGKSPFPKTPTMILALMTLGGLAGAPVLCLASRWKTAPGRLGKILNHEIMAAFRYLSPLSLLAMTGFRMVLILIYGAMNFFFLKSFGVYVPPINLLFFMAITSFIAMVPISVSGIGSTQVAMRELYGPYVPESIAPTAVARTATIDAFSTAGIFSILIIRVVLGLICMKGVSKYLLQDDEKP